MSRHLKKFEPLRDKGENKRIARTEAAQVVREAFALIVPPHANTAEQFCWLVADLADNGGASACTALIDSGCIPKVIEAMRLWPTVDKVVIAASEAVYILCLAGGAQLQQILRTGGCVHLLEAAMRVVDAYDKGKNPVQDAIDILQMPKVIVLVLCVQCRAFIATYVTMTPLPILAYRCYYNVLCIVYYAGVWNDGATIKKAASMERIQPYYKKATSMERRHIKLAGAMVLVRGSASPLSARIHT